MPQHQEKRENTIPAITLPRITSRITSGAAIVDGRYFIIRAPPRDFYDVYILGTTQKYDREVFKEALKATAIHRGSLEKIVDVNGIIEQISSNADLKSMWGKYQKKFAYASDISYENIMEIFSA